MLAPYLLYFVYELAQDERAAGLLAHLGGELVQPVRRKKRLTAVQCHTAVSRFRRTPVPIDKAYCSPAPRP